MYKAIIIDDEKKGRSVIAGLLHRLYRDEIQIVAEADSVETAFIKIKKHHPDVLFLDIQLPDGTGFDLLEKVPQIDFFIIFITAYEQYAIKAFKFSALDFLLKPIDEDELIHAIEKLKKEHQSKTFRDKLDVLLKNRNGYEKIALPSQDGIRFVRIRDIVRCESDSNYTRFYLIQHEKILVTRTLKEYEELLCSEKFFRIHQSHLINLAYVEKYKKGEGGTVIMEDGSEVEVSRRKKEQFLQVLMGR
ncbi:MAG: response regulator transcription factor [Bacteroidales bacterium]|nr:response regulator transcription factor [Bacteroidales bacterium]